jgi:hypothetical protein
LNHDLKIWPQFYSRVQDGSKTFEVRKNDRQFQFGDTVTLREWDPDPVNKTVPLSPAKGYTDSPPLKFRIGYIYVLDSETVVFSLLPFEMPKA